MLYGEGPGDTAGAGRASYEVEVGAPLPDDALGPAHLLVRRALAAARPPLPEPAIRFLEPLRKNAVTKIRGSHLLVPEILHRLVSPRVPAARRGKGSHRSGDSPGRR
jgi:hypothetical protein